MEEEVRTNKAKFEESSEDVLRRMQDIKEAEADSANALNELLDAELDYHERCVEELRRARETIKETGGAMARHHFTSPPRSHAMRPAPASRSTTGRSWQDSQREALHDELEREPAPPRLRNVSSNLRPAPPPPPQPPRPQMSRAATDCRPTPRSTAPPLPLTRVRTDGTAYGNRSADDCFADDASTASGSGSPDIGDRSLSPATSYGSLSRSTGHVAKKAPPPPPPVNRAKKPAPPPVPTRKANLGY